MLLVSIVGEPTGPPCVLACWCHACYWPFRKWVAVVLCYNSSLLMMPILGSLVGEWLWCLAAILACCWCLSLDLQWVSGCGALLQFWPADGAYPWLSRKWVAMAPYCNSSLLMMLVLGFPGSEWLWCLAAILPCWWCLRKWVTIVACCNSSLLMFPILGFPVGEWLWCLAAILACWSCLSLLFSL